jgi:ATP-dependent exoDNAse (exonuclease V) beta subunit
VLRVLRAIDQPGDRLAVVGALRSTVLGCSDADLADWSRSTGARWSVLDAVPDGLSVRSHRVADALAWLGTMVLRSALMTPSEIVQAVIERGDLRRLVSVHRGVDDTLARHPRTADDGVDWTHCATWCVRLNEVVHPRWVWPWRS